MRGPLSRSARQAGLLVVIAVAALAAAGRAGSQTAAPPEAAKEQAPAAQEGAAAAETRSSVALRPYTSVGHYATTCGGQRTDVEIPLLEAVAALEAQAIPYGVGPLSDCSGIFHRVLQEMRQRCPEHSYPAVEKYRDSRDVARWYHEQGGLTLIGDALESAHMIKPGAVLFYGKNGTVYKDFKLEDALAGIDHVGVVVKVHNNAAGQLINYELFHGHGTKGKTTASSTAWHLRVPTKPEYPPFGNGGQQLIAAAHLLPFAK